MGVQPIKILVAGLGSIGRRHLRNLVALGEDDICLYRTQRSTLPEAELAGFPLETDLAAALRQRPSAVIIANPTALHLELAIPAVEAGCHVLLEKPIASSLDRVHELEAARQRSGSRVLVGFQFRYHPALSHIAGWLVPTQSGGASPIGRPLSVHVHWGEFLPGWHPWEDYRRGYSARADLGGGVVLTLSHPLDYLRWLLGEVQAVWALEGRLGDLQLTVEDTAEIGLRFTSGVLGSVHLDYNQRPPVHTLEIIGTHGTLRWDNTDGSVRLFRAVEPAAQAPGGEAAQPDGWQHFPVPAGFERNSLFLAEMRHFLAVARGEAEPVCTLEDGIQALKLALAVHRSAETGRLVCPAEL